jgi:F0F1-type ATP synthase membrane subunit c/vacuolar-type H+-ATPase subunit K
MDAEFQNYIGVSYPNDEIGLAKGLAKYGPVTVCLYVGATYSAYSSGIYNDPECKADHFNHCVLIVGFGNLEN